VIGSFQIGITRFISSINHWLAAKASGRYGAMIGAGGRLQLPLLIPFRRDSPA
jgi:hypothetical protein